MNYAKFKKSREPRFSKKDVDLAFVYGFYVTFSLCLWVLRKDYGFGAKRLEDFIENMVCVFDDLNKYFTIDDVFMALKDETGLEVDTDEVFRGLRF